MATWVKQHAAMATGSSSRSRQTTEAIAAALSAQAELPSQQVDDQNDKDLIQKGIGLIEQHCTSCHKFGDHGQLGLAPDLTGYGSYEWMMGLVSDPTHERFYRQENDRMPSFAKDLAHPEKNNVSVRELSLIVDWLRGQYYVAESKTPILPHTEQQANEAVQLARVDQRPAHAKSSALLKQPRKRSCSTPSGCLRTTAPPATATPTIWDAASPPRTLPRPTSSVSAAGSG